MSLLWMLHLVVMPFRVYSGEERSRDCLSMGGRDAEKRTGGEGQQKLSGFMGNI